MLADECVYTTLLASLDSIARVKPTTVLNLSYFLHLCINLLLYCCAMFFLELFDLQNVLLYQVQTSLLLVNLNVKTRLILHVMYVCAIYCFVNGVISLCL